MRTRSYISVSVVALLLALACVSTSSAVAQNVAPPAAAPATQPSAAPNSQPAATAMTAVSVKIAPGDLLDISVFDAPELAQQVRVGADGTAELALIGRTPLAGLTGQEASDKIARELRDRKFLLRPQVNVLVKEYASQGVSVMGEVQKPGVYQVLGPRTLLDVVSMAGGLTNVADTRITIKRRTGVRENVSVRLKNDDVQSSLANDVQIYPGDLVMVPRAGIVYVLGDVNRPGGFVMQDSGKITLLQALAQAGGTKGTAAANRAVLLRKTGNGYVTNKLHVSSVMNGKAKDMELQPNDVVFIPGSRLKNAFKSTESIASSIGSASIYAVVHP